LCKRVKFVHLILHHIYNITFNEYYSWYFFYKIQVLWDMNEILWGLQPKSFTLKFYILLFYGKLYLIWEYIIFTYLIISQSTTCEWQVECKMCFDERGGGRHDLSSSIRPWLQLFLFPLWRNREFNIALWAPSFCNVTSCFRLSCSIYT